MVPPIWLSAFALLAVVFARKVLGQNLGLIDYLCGISAMLLLVMGVHLQGFRFRRKSRFFEAVAWGRWNKVLRLLPKIEQEISPSEGIFRKAQALAALGKLNEAIEVIQRLANDTSIPESVYCSRLAEVYLAAGVNEPIVPALERAVALDPENVTLKLDLAMTLMRFDREQERVRELLKVCETDSIDPRITPYLEMVKGVLALKEERPEQALQYFEKSLDGISRDQHLHPLARAVIDRIYAYLALAEAELGHADAARQHFRRAELRLNALGAVDLIKSYEQAIEQTGTTR